MKESDLIAPVIDLLNQDGYFAVASPDGTDFYDVLAIKGEPDDFELMGVELKLSQPKEVYCQAFLRRMFCDTMTICMPKLKSIKTVAQYDKDGTMGLMSIAGNDAAWYYRPKTTPVDTYHTKRHDRIAGVVFAIREGIIERSPSAAFMAWDTDTIMGKRVEKYVRDWPDNIQRLILGAVKYTMLREPKAEPEPTFEQLRLEG